MGILVETVSDEEFQWALDNEEKNELIADLIAYASSAQETSTVYMDVDNSFLTKAFYRRGFQWPMSDNTYVKHALQTLEILGFFDGKI